jgi:N-alpha-acetyltransferase 50
MSLPTSKPGQQSSIKSFFTAKTPKYAPPPTQNGSRTPPTAPSTQSTSLPETARAPPPPPTPQAAPSSPSATASREIPPLPSTLAPEASIQPVSAADINALRRINALLLPVAYPDEFYQRLTDPSAGRFSRVIRWAHAGEEAKVVGGVVCRLEPHFAGSTSQTLYIRSLCLLSPYRSLGLVSAAVDNIVATAIADLGEDVKTVTAHVWTDNEEGLQWYENRGFKRGSQPIKGYYMKLRPDSAWLVQRNVAHDNTLLSTSTTNSESAPTSTIEPSVTAAAVNLPPMGGPPRPSVQSRTESGQSFQNRRAETEWNDLPEEMASGRLAPPKKAGNSEPASAASSRSSSTARKKRDRSYPAAAFGS